MEKKISFGFSKVTKKNIFVNKLIPKEDNNKVELIKCLEDQSIQLVKKNVEVAPLVIPLKDSRKTSAALLSLKTRQAVLNGEDIPAQEEILKPTVEPKLEEAPNGNFVDDIEKRAAKELLAEINKADGEDSVTSNLILPIKAEDLPLDGAKESTIDDYDSIPIQQFGMAMLRGMGWKDEPKKKGALVEEGPIMRPKGMGLGADKALKPKALLVAPEANEILEIKKGACVRVLGGKHKDLYGLVEGLDDHAGRVIVKMALGSTKESFNEFMVQPVSKKEFAQYSKCINSAKYDEYKRKENEMGQIPIKKEETFKKEDNIKPESSHSKHRNNDDDRKYERYKVSSRRNSSESENHPRKTERRSRSREKRSEDFSRSSTSHKKYSSGRSHSRNRSKSDDSRSSNSSTYNRKHKKKSSKSKKSKKSKDKSRQRRHSSQSSTGDERRHKKKTKKSKRGRSRSRSKGRR